MPAYLPIEHPVARLDLQGLDLAVVLDLARADGDDLTLHRLLLGRVGDDDATADRLGGLGPLDEDAVVERLHSHGNYLQ